MKKKLLVHNMQLLVIFGAISIHIQSFGNDKKMVCLLSKQEKSKLKELCDYNWAVHYNEREAFIKGVLYFFRFQTKENLENGIRKNLRVINGLDYKEREVYLKEFLNGHEWIHLPDNKLNDTQKRICTSNPLITQKRKRIAYLLKYSSE